MRDFDQYFEFDYTEATASRTREARIDSHETVTTDPNRVGDPEHEKRLAVHTERVQREMQELGILYKRNYT